MNLPVLNKTYNCFDDGKIRESRLYQVVINKIVPFNEIGPNLLSMWKDEVKTCHWLFKSTTDYFIFTTNEDNNSEVFVRTKDGDWFSICKLFGGGRLDID